MAVYKDFTFTLDPDEVSFKVPEVVEGAEMATVKVIGNALNNVLEGSDGKNRLFGGLGNDTLIGHLGNDDLNGGEGFDTVSYAYSAADLRIDLNTQTPPPPALVATTDSDTYTSIEGVIGSNHNDTIVGTDAVGELLDGGNGIDNIQGGDGNDTIIGGAGADILWGGAGTDTLSYEGSNLGVNISLANGSEPGRATSTGHAQGDTYYEFENVIGSSFGDSLNGNNSNNRIDGGQGNDILTGKLGDDTLDGGAGIDDLQGEQGNDLYYVDNPADNVRERDGYGYDTVVTSVSYILPYQEIEVLGAAVGAGAISLTGNVYANLIFGNEAANIIDGKGGADTMQGGAGDDTYTVEHPSDIVIEDSAFGGTDLVNTSISYALMANVENLTGTGTAAISLTGNALNNVIIGNSGNNIITGGGGADVMMGGGGNDTYYVDDLGDRVIDNSGIDTVIATNPKVLAALASTIENVTAAPGKVAVNLTGNSKKNTLKGNSGANKITGLDGNDKLYGGAGKDTFIFKGKATKSNKDTVYDYKAKDDSVWIDNKYMSKLGKGSEKKPGKLKKAFFTVGEKAQDANDYLIYNKKTGVLYYDKDGWGGAKQVEIAKFNNKPTLKYSEFYII